MACWDGGFESRRRHGCLSLLDVVCCQVVVFATGRSPIQRSLTDRGVSLCGIYKLQVWGGLGRRWAVAHEEKWHLPTFWTNYCLLPSPLLMIIVIIMTTKTKRWRRYLDKMAVFWGCYVLEFGACIIRINVAPIYPEDGGSRFFRKSVSCCQNRGFTSQKMTIVIDTAVRNFM